MPEAAGDELVQAGAKIFKSKCSHCHTVNEGGNHLASGGGDQSSGWHGWHDGLLDARREGVTSTARSTSMCEKFAVG